MIDGLNLASLYTVTESLMKFSKGPKVHVVSARHSPR